MTECDCLHLIVSIVIFLGDIFNYFNILFELLILPPISIKIKCERFTNLAIVGNKTIYTSIHFVYVYMLMPESKIKNGYILL